MTIHTRPYNLYTTSHLFLHTSKALLHLPNPAPSLPPRATITTEHTPLSSHHNIIHPHDSHTRSITITLPYSLFPIKPQPAQIAQAREGQRKPDTRNIRGGGGGERENMPEMDSHTHFAERTYGARKYIHTHVLSSPPCSLLRLSLSVSLRWREYTSARAVAKEGGAAVLTRERGPRARARFLARVPSFLRLRRRMVGNIGWWWCARLFRV